MPSADFSSGELLGFLHRLWKPISGSAMHDDQLRTRHYSDLLHRVLKNEQELIHMIVRLREDRAMLPEAGSITRRPQFIASKFTK